MRVAIVGSRTFTNPRVIAEAITRLQEKYDDLTIVSGGAKGTDSLAAAIVVARKIPLTVHLPEWSVYGKSAGFRRNQTIVDDSDMIIAFFADGPRSAGTNHTVHIARDAGKEIQIYHEGAWS